MSKVWQGLSNYTKNCTYLLIVTVLDNENRRILFRVADQLEISSKYRYLARCCGNEIILGIRSENVIKKLFLYSCHLYAPKRALVLQAFLKFKNVENYQNIPTHLLKLESSQHQYGKNCTNIKIPPEIFSFKRYWVIKYTMFIRT